MFLSCFIIYLLVNAFNASWSAFFLPALHFFWIFDFKKKTYHSKIYFQFCSLGLLLVFFQDPIFENDHYRYFLDGSHYLQGLPVYDLPPNQSPSVDNESELARSIGFPTERTVYPPVLVAFFSMLVHLSSNSHPLFCLLFKLCSFLSLAPILYLLFKKALFKFPIRTTVFSLLNPLVFFEIFRNLHFEFLTCVGILGFFYFKGRLSYLSYFWTVSLRPLYAPGVLLDLTKRNFLKQTAAASLGFLLFWVTPTLFLNGSLLDLRQNMNWIGLNWEMNSGFFRWTRELVYSFSSDGLFAIEMSYAVSSGLILLFTVFLMRNSRLSLIEKVTLLGCFAPLVSPVVNPWYFTPTVLLTFFVRTPAQISLFFFHATLSGYYLFFLIPGQLEVEPGIWLEIEHFLLWSTFAYATWTFIRRPTLQVKPVRS